MTDIHDKATRSYNMSRIRGKDTSPEKIVRKYLFSKGLRYRVHASNLPGRPDIVLAKFKTVVFVHGCFWHAHERCSRFVLPKTRRKWWRDKLSRNKERDKENIAALTEQGWQVLEIWECELDEEHLRNLTEKVKGYTQSGKS